MCKYRFLCELLLCARLTSVVKVVNMNRAYGRHRCRSHELAELEIASDQTKTALTREILVLARPSLQRRQGVGGGRGAHGGVRQHAAWTRRKRTGRQDCAEQRKHAVLVWRRVQQGSAADGYAACGSIVGSWRKCLGMGTGGKGCQRRMCESCEAAPDFLFWRHTFWIIRAPQREWHPPRAPPPTHQQQSSAATQPSSGARLVAPGAISGVCLHIRICSLCRASAFFPSPSKSFAPPRMSAEFDEAATNPPLPSEPLPKGKAPDKPQDVRDDCVICLCHISERAIAVPCNHSAFDFVCLVNWLEQRSNCPLCNAEVSKVEYDWASPTEFKSYDVPSTQPTPATAPTGPSPLARSRPRLTRRDAYREQAVSRPIPLDPNEAVLRRRDIYRNQLYSLHVGSNRESRHRDFTPTEFANSPILQSRAKTWIRRELQVFAFLNPDYREDRASSAPDQNSAVGTESRARRASNAEFLLNYLIAILKTVDIKGSSGQAEDMLQEFLGRENARLFLHELNAWLRSPYANPNDWDRHVQYPPKPPHDGAQDDRRSGRSTGSVPSASSDSRQKDIG
jgi:hypothetical protein